LARPAGGGRAPKFCSDAHRAQYNRSRPSAPPLPGTARAQLAALDDAVAMVRDASRAVSRAGAGIRDLVAAHAPEALRDQLEAAQHELEDLRAAAAGHQRDRAAAERQMQLLEQALESERALRRARETELEDLRGRSG